jgi:1-pyrroline-5-carboxylate dehydrogenase
MGNVGRVEARAHAMRSALGDRAGDPRRGGPAPGVVNLVSATRGDHVGAALDPPDLAGVHFTGSTRSSSRCGRTVGRTSPKLPRTRASSARPAARTSSSRTPAPTWTRWRWPSCAAASSTRARSARRPRACTCRASLWPRVRERVVGIMIAEHQGRRPRGLQQLHGRRDRPARLPAIAGYIDSRRKTTQGAHVGAADDRDGLVHRAHARRVDDPGHALMREEIFGPLVTAWVYPDDAAGRGPAPLRRDHALRAHRRRLRPDRRAIAQPRPRAAPRRGQLLHQRQAHRRRGRPAALRRRRARRAPTTRPAARWQPLRWVSARTIKETFVPPTDWRYPFLDAP